MSAKHLLTEHIPNLRRYAIALLRDRGHADDLVQDTLERALGKFSQFQQGSDLRAWLFSIMHSIFINQVSRKRRINYESFSEYEPGSSGDQVEELVVARDMSRALQQLPDEQRVLILLIGLEQLSYNQAAQVLNVPVGTVMSRLCRARERLQALLNGDSLPQLRRIK